MYLCVENEDSSFWCEPQGRSLFEFAELYQRMSFSSKHVKFVNNKLLVNFYNIHNYAFSVGRKYYLFLEPDYMGNIQITLKFNELDYVADIFRMPVGEIHESTKQTLKIKTLPMCPSEEVEFQCNDNFYAPDDESDEGEEFSDLEEYEYLEPFTDLVLNED